MSSQDIRNLWVRFFEAHGHRRIPSSSLIPVGRPDAAVHHGRHGAAQALVHGPGRTAGAPPDLDPEVLPHQRHRGGGRRTATAPSSRCWATSASATTSSRRSSPGPGSCSRRRGRKGWAWTSRASGRRSTWTTTSRTTCGARWACRRSASAATARRRTTGSWGAIGPCGPNTEINYDFGADKGCLRPDCAPNCENPKPDGSGECDRFLELWNLVFMTLYQDGRRHPDAPAAAQRRHRRRLRALGDAAAVERGRRLGGQAQRLAGPGHPADESTTRTSGGRSCGRSASLSASLTRRRTPKSSERCASSATMRAPRRS